MLFLSSMAIVMAVSLACVLFVLGVYWIIYRIYLLLEDNVLAKYEFWRNFPGGIRRPKFWQFATALYLINKNRHQ